MRGAARRKFDSHTYGRLLSRARPRTIHNDKELEAMTAELLRLTSQERIRFKHSPYRLQLVRRDLWRHAIRDRLFFFGDYQGSRDVLGQSNIPTIPTLA